MLLVLGPADEIGSIFFGLRHAQARMLRYPDLSAYCIFGVME